MIRLLLIMLLFTACSTDRAQVTIEDIDPEVPEGFEIFDKKTIRKELKPSNLEMIVPKEGI